jgi:hypothetical protein
MAMNFAVPAQAGSTANAARGPSFRGGPSSAALAGWRRFVGLRIWRRSLSRRTSHPAVKAAPRRRSVAFAPAVARPSRRKQQIWRTNSKRLTWTSHMRGGGRPAGLFTSIDQQLPNNRELNQLDFA